MVSAAPVTAESPNKGRTHASRHRLSVGLRVVAMIVVGYIGLQVVIANSAELSGATDYLSRADWRWIALAAAAEAVSYLAFTFLQRRLLAAGGVQVGLLPLGAISLAGNAITNSLPGGGAFASVFAYRQLRRRGADEALSTWTILAFTALTAVMLAALAVVGLIVAGSDGPVGGLGPLLIILLIGPLLAFAVLLRPGLLAAVVHPVGDLSRRLIGHPGLATRARVDRLVEHIGTVRPTTGEWMAAAAWALGNWIADCACLVLAFQAVHVHVPWRGLLVAYGAAQVAANLPITPGGLGVVEGSLTVALVAYGGATTQTVAAVLLYRILSFWAVLPIGWTAWAALNVEGRRHQRAQSVLATAGGAG